MGCPAESTYGGAQPSALMISPRLMRSAVPHGPAAALVAVAALDPALILAFAPRELGGGETLLLMANGVRWRMRCTASNVLLSGAGCRCLAPYASCCFGSLMAGCSPKATKLTVAASMRMRVAKKSSSCSGTFSDGSGWRVRCKLSTVCQLVAFAVPRPTSASSAFSCSGARPSRPASVLWGDWARSSCVALMAYHTLSLSSNTFGLVRTVRSSDAVSGAPVLDGACDADGRPAVARPAIPRACGRAPQAW